MIKVLKYCIWFSAMAGLGILGGCWIHGIRTNQPTIMSGVAFVRELPYGEQIVGRIETTVFSYQERKNLENFREQHKEIKIDPEVLKRHQEMFESGKK